MFCHSLNVILISTLSPSFNRPKLHWNDLQLAWRQPCDIKKVFMSEITVKISTLWCTYKRKKARARNVKSSFGLEISARNFEHYAFEHHPWKHSIMPKTTKYASGQGKTLEQLAYEQALFWGLSCVRMVEPWKWAAKPRESEQRNCKSEHWSHGRAALPLAFTVPPFVRETPKESLLADYCTANLSPSLHSPATCSLQCHAVCVTACCLLQLCHWVPEE